MLTARDLWRMPRGELRAILAAGEPFDPDAIADAEYRGVSLGLPAMVERLTWKTFKKVFYRDPSGSLRGWNVRIRQTGVEPPFIATTRGDAPIAFGHYAVLSTERGLLLDYGQYAGALDPLRFVRDPVVAVNAGDCALLLGTTHLELPFGRVATPSFFTLERDGAIGHCAKAPSQQSRS